MNKRELRAAQAGLDRAMRDDGRVNPDGLRADYFGDHERRNQMMADAEFGLVLAAVLAVGLMVAVFVGLL